MLISVQDLHKSFRGPDGSTVTAVDGVSFDVAAGETLGLVGESGCGKSTVGRCVLRLTDPDSGRIAFEGTDIERMSQRRLRPLRRRLQIVFQDPLGSTNPAFSLRQTLGDALREARVNRDRREQRTRELLDSVGLPSRLLDRRRDELSGGQLQRGSIARALAPEPAFVFLDEPTSSLDVSVRGQIINLLAELQDELGHAYLFASHDLGVVRVLAHRVIVMYLGRIVEAGTTETILGAPRHPYTQALLEAAGEESVSAAAPLGALDDMVTPAAGEPPMHAGERSGCRYRERCPYRHGRCETEPGLLSAGDAHVARCWLVEDREPLAGRSPSITTHERNSDHPSESEGVL